MNLENIRIIQAGASEAAAIADLSRTCFCDTYAVHNTPENMDLFLSGPFSRELLIREVEEGDGIFPLIILNNRPIAYARMRRAPPPGIPGESDAIEIVRFYAHRSVIGQGIGRRLMEHCVGLARGRSAGTIWLGVWEKNLPAIGFYEKMGFRKWSEHGFMLGRDAQTDWLMKRATGPEASSYL
jgi:diamine N-acetyltransferase